MGSPKSSAWWLVVMATLGGSALGSSALGCQARVTLGASCARSSECEEPLVCADGRCRAQCAEDRDCASTSGSCVVFAGAGVCVMPSEPLPCAYASDCALDQTCIEGSCHAVCASDTECGAGRCVAGACAAPVPAPAPTDAGIECVYDHECAAPLVCLQGRCRPECVVDRDCALGLGEVCVSNVCTSFTPPCDAGTDGGC